MLERLNEQFPALVALENEPSVSKHANTTLRNWFFSFEEQSIIESVVEILQAFEKATTIISADKTPTIHKNCQL